MSEKSKPINKEAARAYFKEVGSLARSEPNKNNRVAFYADLKQDPEYEAARQALDPRLSQTSLSSKTIPHETIFPTPKSPKDQIIQVPFKPNERLKITMAAARIGQDHSTFMRAAAERAIGEIAEKAGGVDKLLSWYKDVQDSGKDLGGSRTNLDNDWDLRKNPVNPKDSARTVAKIKQFVTAQDTPPTMREIAEATGYSYENIRLTLSKMQDVIRVDLPDDYKPGKKAQGIRFRDLEEQHATDSVNKQKETTVYNPSSNDKN